MSTEEKLDQAINPQPEHDEPSAPPARPEQDESRIGGQARTDAASPERAPAQDDDAPARPTNTGTGAHHD